MLNQAILVGRIAEIEDYEIVLTVPRNYKNEEGIYEDDVIKILLTKKLNDNAIEYLEKGDLVGVKGHIINKDGVVSVAADKLTFLSSKKEN